MDADQQFAFAVTLLKGTHANFVLCCVSMVASVAFAVAGVLLMTEDTTHRTLSIQSILFLMSASFTLTRVSRDWSIFKADDIARPTIAYFGQTALFFLVALACSVQSLVSGISGIEWQSFYAMSIVWVVTSTLCLSKTVRDRNDAAISMNVPAEQKLERLPEILRMCHGTLEYQALVWVSALISIAMMLGLMWTWEDDLLAIERKGFVSVCVLWCVASSYHFAKLVRDRADHEKSKELSRQIPFQFLVAISAVGSFATLLIGVCLMPLDTPKRLFLLTGCGFVLSTAFFLAKHVRDRLEVRNLSFRSEESSSSVPEGPA